MKPSRILHEKTQRFLRGRQEWHVNLLTMEMKPGCILHEKTQRFLRGRREWHVNLQSKWRPGAFYTRKHNDFSGVGGGLRRGCIIRNRDTVGTLAWYTVHIGTAQYVRSCGTVGKMVRCSRYYGRVVRRRGTLYPTSVPKFWKSSQPTSQVSPPILHLWQPILHFSQRIFGYTKVVRWKHCTIVPSYRTTVPYRTWHRTPPYVPYHRTVLHTAPNRTYHKPHSDIAGPSEDPPSISLNTAPCCSCCGTWWPCGFSKHLRNFIRWSFKYVFL